MSVIHFASAGGLADFIPADTGPLSGTLTAIAGIAVLDWLNSCPILVTGTLNVHGPTGSLVTVQIFDAVANVVLAQAQVTLNGVGAADDYRAIVLQASSWSPYTSTADRSAHYGYELLAQVSGGSASVVGGGLSAVGANGRPAGF